MKSASFPLSLEAEMAADTEPTVPEGAAVFPLIPPELDIQPLLLGVLHATVFLLGSAEELVNQDAAGEAADYIGGYLQRLAGADLERVRADMNVLVDFARREKWSKREIQFLKSFLDDCNVETKGKA
jgi:hypothetical protein